MTDSALLCSVRVVMTVDVVSQLAFPRLKLFSSVWPTYTVSIVGPVTTVIARPVGPLTA